jgi:hypothetical protein
MKLASASHGETQNFAVELPLKKRCEITLKFANISFREGEKNSLN